MSEQLATRNGTAIEGRTRWFALFVLCLGV